MFGGEVLAFVGNVVDQAHEGVKGGQGVALGLRQKEKSVIEIAIRGAGDAMAVFVRVRNGDTGLRGSVRNLGNGSSRGFRRRLCTQSGQVFDQRANEKARLLQFADSRAFVESVVADGLDGVENGEAATAKHFEVDAETLIDHS